MTERSIELDTEALNTFSGIMFDKLRENKFKVGWKELSSKTLYSLLLDEVRELHDAIYIDGNLVNIQKEAADVANFAMMLSDNMRRY